MIKLGRKDSSPTIAEGPGKARVYYPSFHVSNVDLGLGEEDVGKELTATVRIKVNSAGQSVRTDGKDTKKSHDYSIDVLGIEFKGIKGSKPNADWSVSDIMKHTREEK